MKTSCELVEDNLTIKTRGIVGAHQYKLKATVGNLILLPTCKELLHYVISYINETGNIIQNGETMIYGYWMIKFNIDQEGFLEIWEYKPDASGFVEGVNTTLTYWNDQHEICRRYRADFIPPRPDQKVAISDGVYEGKQVEGVRYPSPNHMSGWWLTTDKYNGDIKSLNVVHLYHVTAIRPDIAELIALPYGFRFFTNPLRVWFDKGIK